MTTPTFWRLPENVAALTQWWADGVSERDIARRFGISRHAVHGKARRLGLPSRGDGSELHARLYAQRRIEKMRHDANAVD